MTDRRRALIDLDRRHVWRPYTSSEDQDGRDPFVIERAEGPYLYDIDGRRYIDANGSWWCNTLGHGHPRLRAALVRQSETLMHCSLAGTTHEGAARLAAELIEVAPRGLARVFFSDDGSTALEVALKIAVQFFHQNGEPRRRRFLSLQGAFHGDTVGAMSLSGVREFLAPFSSLLFEVVHAPVEGSFDSTVDWIENHLVEHGADFAGVVIEPLIQGAAGMRMHAPSHVARIAAATRRAGALLIADEVFTGYGRTGAMWASEHSGITPDLLCTAKAFSGGVLPFAATLATASVFDGFRGGKARALLHGHTFAGNPLGAAIAREVLAIYRDEGVLEEVRDKTPLIRVAFEQFGAELSPRCTGMVAAVDLGNAGYYGDRGWAVSDAARIRGVYLRPLGNTVYICPPLTIPRDTLATLLEVVAESVAASL